MDKKAQRAVITYLHIKGMAPTEIYKNMTETLKNYALSVASVKIWVNEIKPGKESRDDEHRSR